MTTPSSSIHITKAEEQKEAQLKIDKLGGIKSLPPQYHSASEKNGILDGGIYTKRALSFFLSTLGVLAWASFIYSLIIYMDSHPAVLYMALPAILSTVLIILLSFVPQNEEIDLDIQVRYIQGRFIKSGDNAKIRDLQRKSNRNWCGLMTLGMILLFILTIDFFVIVHFWFSKPSRKVVNAHILQHFSDSPLLDDEEDEDEEDETAYTMAEAIEFVSSSLYKDQKKLDEDDTAFWTSVKKAAAAKKELRIRFEAERRWIGVLSLYQLFTFAFIGLLIRYTLTTPLSVAILTAAIMSSNSVNGL